MRALMDPFEVVIGASILSESSCLPLVPPDDGADMDGVRGVVSRDHNAYLEDEGESFPSPPHSIIPRSPSGCFLSLFLYFFVISYLSGAKGRCFAVLLSFSFS